MLSRRELAKVVAGAAALNSVAAAHADQMPVRTVTPKPADVITQSEIREILDAELMMQVRVYRLRRRLLDGATVEAGPCSLRNEAAAPLEDSLPVPCNVYMAGLDLNWQQTGAEAEAAGRAAYVAATA